MKTPAGESFALHMQAVDLCDNVVAKAHAKEDIDKQCLNCAGSQLRPSQPWKRARQTSGCHLHGLEVHLGIRPDSRAEGKLWPILAFPSPCFGF